VRDDRIVLYALGPASRALLTALAEELEASA
jgi:hypothetical protein